METIKAPTLKEIEQQIKKEIKRLDKIANDKTKIDLIRKKAHRLKIALMAIDPERERKSRIERAQFFTYKLIK